jgi:hypothetical protein
VAKKVMLVDDFDDETPASETVLFAIDSDAYSTDLSAERAAELRDLLAPYREVATKIGRFRPDKRAGRRVAPAALTKPRETATEPESDGRPWYKYDRDGVPERETAKKQYRDMAKEWGRKNGFTIGSRGVVAEEVFTAYEDHRRRKGMPLGPAAVGLG